MFLNSPVSAPGEAASIMKSRAEPSRAEPSRAEPSRAEPSRAEPSRAEPSRAEPSRAEPSRAEPSRAEPSRAEPSRAEPSRAEPSLGYCLSSSWLPGSLHSAPLGAQSNPLPTVPGGAAPASRRGEAAAGGRGQSRLAPPGPRRPAFAGVLASVLQRRAPSAALPRARYGPLDPHRSPDPSAAPERAPSPNRRRPDSPQRSRRIRRAAVVLLGWAVMLGAGSAGAVTLTSNLGQTSESGGEDLSMVDAAQAFTTGSNAADYEITAIKVKFVTVPTNTATVTAWLTDGRTATDEIVATLTNPATWTTTSTFGVPSGTVLDASATYYLILSATDGSFATSGSATLKTAAESAGWSIGNGQSTFEQRQTAIRWEADGASRTPTSSRLPSKARSRTTPRRR